MTRNDWFIFIAISALFVVSIVFIILSLSKKNAPRWYLFIGLGSGFIGNLINLIRILSERTLK